MNKVRRYSLDSKLESGKTLRSFLSEETYLASFRNAFVKSIETQMHHSPSVYSWVWCRCEIKCPLSIDEWAYPEWNLWSRTDSVWRDNNWYKALKQHKHEQCLWCQVHWYFFGFLSGVIRIFLACLSKFDDFIRNWLACFEKVNFLYVGSCCSLRMGLFFGQV